MFSVSVLNSCVMSRDKTFCWLLGFSVGHIELSNPAHSEILLVRNCVVKFNIKYLLIGCGFIDFSFVQHFHLQHEQNNWKVV